MTTHVAPFGPIGRRQFIQTCAGSLSLAAIGCRWAGDPAYRRGSTLVMAVSDVNDIKPDVTDLDFLLFLPLATMDERGELEPRLAQSWDHSPDYRDWTYHLRTDVRWNDGTPVTAHDVKFTLDLLSHPDVHEYVFDSVTVLDDFTVKIRGNPLYRDDIVFYPKHLLEHLDPKKFWEWDFWTRPVGNGPFRFVRHVPEAMIEFEANPDYYQGKPKIARVVLKFVGKAGFTELLSGNADIVRGDLAQIPRVARDPRFRVYHQIYAGGKAIYWKCDHALFRDVAVRRALTFAINRRELLRVLNLPADLPIVDGVFTGRQLSRRQFPEALPYDPEQSRALLEAAGWQDPHGDGVRERDGRPFRFTAIVHDGDGFNQMAVYVQAMLSRVGVRMDLQVLNEGLMWKKLGGGDFEAAFMWQQWGADEARKRYLGRDNPTGYRNPEAIRLIDQAVATGDPDELDRIYRKLAEILRADLPLTRLVPATLTTFVHRRVRGLTTPFHAKPDKYMEDLWLEEEG